MCPGGDIVYTCIGNSLSTSLTRWDISSNEETTQCYVEHNKPEIMQTCGPNDIFTSSLTGQSGPNFTSSLRADNVPLSVNGTRVECVDTLVEKMIESANICIVGQ